MDYTDERKYAFKTETVATAGTKNLDLLLPTHEPGSVEVRDLQVSVANATAARGYIMVFIYDSTIKQVSGYVDIILTGFQKTSVIYLTAFRSGSVIPVDCAKPLLRAAFTRCVVADDIDLVISYTLRRFE